MGINARELIGLSLILAAATPYLREALRFIGVSDVRFALIGPTVGPGVGRGGPSASRRRALPRGGLYNRARASIRAPDSRPAQLPYLKGPFFSEPLDSPPFRHGSRNSIVSSYVGHF